LENNLITEAEIHLVTVNKNGKPTKIPKILSDGLN